MEDPELQNLHDCKPSQRPQGIRWIPGPSTGLISFLMVLCTTLLLITITLIVSMTREGVDQTEQILEEKMRTINETMRSKVTQLSVADDKMMDKVQSIEETLKAFSKSGVSEDMKEIESLVKQILSHEVKGSLSRDIGRILAVVGRLAEEVRYKNGSLDPLCEKGWTHYGGSCYFLSPRMRPWLTAKRECEGKKAHLVVINGKEEMEFLSDLVHEQSMWIGLRSHLEIDWKWVDGTSYTVTPKFWMEDQPDVSEAYWLSAEEIDYCAELREEGWISFRCEESSQYICEKKR